ncbi:hypothetical protein PoB_004922200 [Plakobranchus ocellatus]|uniref:Uncharacterized protein n=1 Tax=Plakobranchus ocellatus TaxID=259542 RepID=A0AAV4BTI4_9GAST|nr:hypothetical protein PoB_004922200 [Plakobranchus ocellatus]
MTCSYYCELKAVSKCSHRETAEGAALPGVAIFIDCRDLVQALGGSGRFAQEQRSAQFLIKSEAYASSVGPSATRLVCQFCVSSLRGTGRNSFACFVQMPGILSDDLRSGWAN